MRFCALPYIYIYIYAKCECGVHFDGHQRWVPEHLEFSNKMEFMAIEGNEIDFIRRM